MPGVRLADPDEGLGTLDIWRATPLRYGAWRSLRTTFTHPSWAVVVADLRLTSDRRPLQ
jgi:hypothetical protein